MTYSVVSRIVTSCMDDEVVIMSGLSIEDAESLASFMRVNVSGAEYKIVVDA